MRVNENRNLNGNKRIKRRSQIASIWLRFKRNKLAVFGLCLLVFLIFMAVFAPLFASYSDDAIKQDIYNKLQRPSAEHIFGTDHYGRDLFARVIYGARISLLVGILTVSLSLTFGAVIGATAGFFGGIADNVLMRIMDVFLSLPQTIMAVAIVAALGPGLQNLIFAMVVASTPWFARVVRSTVLSIRGQDFIEAARSCGTSNRRIILRHVLPNTIGPIIVQATLEIGLAIMSIAALSFIGLGIQAPTPEWGSMLSEGKAYMLNSPYLVIIPGIAIVLSVMALNLIGDGLRDALDPRMKN